MQDLWKYFEDDSAWSVLNENIKKFQTTKFDRIFVYVGDLKGLREPGEKENFVYHAMTEARDNIKDNGRVDLLCCPHVDRFLQDYLWMNFGSWDEWEAAFREIRVGCMGECETNRVIDCFLKENSIEYYLDDKVVRR